MCVHMVTFFIILTSSITLHLLYFLNIHVTALFVPEQTCKYENPLLNYVLVIIIKVSTLL